MDELVTKEEHDALEKSVPAPVRGLEGLARAVADDVINSRPIDWDAERWEQVLSQLSPDRAYMLAEIVAHRVAHHVSNHIVDRPDLAEIAMRGLRSFVIDLDARFGDARVERVRLDADGTFFVSSVPPSIVVWNILSAAGAPVAALCHKHLARILLPIMARTWPEVSGLRKKFG